MTDEPRKPLFSKAGIAIIFCGIGMMIGWVIGVNIGVGMADEIAWCQSDKVAYAKSCEAMKWYLF
jgi:hypothetical protein